MITCSRDCSKNDQYRYFIPFLLLRLSKKLNVFHLKLPSVICPEGFGFLNYYFEHNAFVLYTSFCDILFSFVVFNFRNC